MLNPPIEKYTLVQFQVGLKNVNKKPGGANH